MNDLGETNKKNLYIAMNKLPTCSAFTFVLTVVAAKTKMNGFATITFNTTCPPVPPTNNLVTLTTGDSVGVQLSSIFSSTSGWSSPYQPLTYVYDYFTTADPSE
jgi:hypothetical protein